ncbi:D-isomer specific 2-hydroxyacid dehydrogenase [Bisporella sp. PMI_857]|nr:D-isomer specific 2-hydroxyacid dehydrogenase [Bisporella sp. PMI_857]
MIGKQIETVVIALGMPVLVAGRRGAVLRAGCVDFENILRRCATLMLACPSNETTRYLITTHEIQLMQSCAILINVSRGSGWCEADVVKALEKNIIASVGTDVFEEEPANKDKNPFLKGKVKGLLVSPHIAWVSMSASANCVSRSRRMLRRLWQVNR